MRWVYVIEERKVCVRLRMLQWRSLSRWDEGMHLAANRAIPTYLKNNNEAVLQGQADWEFMVSGVKMTHCLVDRLIASIMQLQII